MTSPQPRRHVRHVTITGIGQTINHALANLREHIAESWPGFSITGVIEIRRSAEPLLHPDYTLWYTAKCIIAQENPVTVNAIPPSPTPEPDFFPNHWNVTPIRPGICAPDGRTVYRLQRPAPRRHKRRPIAVVMLGEFPDGSRWELAIATFWTWRRAWNYVHTMTARERMFGRRDRPLHYDAVRTEAWMFT